MAQSAPASTVETGDERLTALKAWLATLADQFGLVTSSLRSASADASARRYFRVDCDGGTVIAMDAPPPGEDTRPFVRIAALMRAAGMHVPTILASDTVQGFLLLSDLGETTYLAALNDRNAAELFEAAIGTLIRWQSATADGVLPLYDETLLRRELALFPDWFVARHLQRQLSAAQRIALEDAFKRIVAANLAQPQVFVHRDYMPRNLIVSNPNPGVLDFQDAVTGPLAYDVVSLFRDAFISWDDERVRAWARLYFDRARTARLPVHAHFDVFWRDFEWIGVQRHLKVLGIFARIRYRDGKPHYLEDAPRFIGYVRAVCERYKELVPVVGLFDELGLA